MELLNQTYKTNFDLYNWINHNDGDDVAYFLDEAGSNVLNYSDYKSPSNFQFWLGGKGFIIGIEQQGEGFNAEKINKQRIKENEGAGFHFFRDCESKIFFDNAKCAKIIYLMQLF